MKLKQSFFSVMLKKAITETIEQDCSYTRIDMSDIANDIHNKVDLNVRKTHGGGVLISVQWNEEWGTALKESYYRRPNYKEQSIINVSVLLARGLVEAKKRVYFINSLYEQVEKLDREDQSNLEAKAESAGITTIYEEMSVKDAHGIVKLI
jgi:hypothetical protein